MKQPRKIGLVLFALALALPIFGSAVAQVPVIGPTTFTFTAASQSNVWTCNSGQSTFALTVPSGLTGTFTVTVAQTSSGTYINPPNSYAPGSSTYANTITNNGSLTVSLGANGYVKVADTSYSSGSATVTGVCSGSNGSAPAANTSGATPIPWTSASPEPVSCVSVAAVGICPTPIPYSLASPLPIQLPTSFPGNFPTPVPYPTSSALPGTLKTVQTCPSTAPAALNGGYDCVLDSNGRGATRIYDATTSTQGLAISAGGVASVHDAAPVQPSPLYTMPVSLNTSAPLPVSTASANPLPTASAGASPPANAPHVVAWLACVTNAGAAPVTTGGNGQAALCPNGILQVNTPAPQPTVSPGNLNGSVNYGPASANTVNGVNSMIVDANGRQATRLCDGTTSTQCGKILANGTQVIGATSGNGSILTSSSATACTSLATTAEPSVILTNTGPAMTVFLQLYDEAGSPTCAAADLIYGDGSTIVLGPGQVIILYGGVKNGVAYKLSGSLTNNLVISW